MKSQRYSFISIPALIALVGIILCQQLLLAIGLMFNYIVTWYLVFTIQTILEMMAIFVILQILICLNPALICPAFRADPHIETHTLGIANWLTVWRIICSLRIIEIAILTSLKAQVDPTAIFWLFLIGALTDLDGTVARRLGQTTELGFTFDPLADKTLFGLGLISLWILSDGTFGSYFRPSDTLVFIIIILAREIAKIIMVKLDEIEFAPNRFDQARTICLFIWLISATGAILGWGSFFIVISMISLVAAVILSAGPIFILILMGLVYAAMARSCIDDD